MYHSGDQVNCQWPSQYITGGTILYRQVIHAGHGAGGVAVGLLMLWYYRPSILMHASLPFSFTFCDTASPLVGGVAGIHVVGTPGHEELRCLGSVPRLRQHVRRLMQGVVLVVTAGFVVINVAVDVLYAVLDPRLRTGRLAHG